MPDRKSIDTDPEFDINLFSYQLQEFNNRLCPGTTDPGQSNPIHCTIGWKTDIVECDRLYPQAYNLFYNPQKIFLDTFIIRVHPGDTFIVNPDPAAVICNSIVFIIGKIFITKTDDTGNKF